MDIASINLAINAAYNIAIENGGKRAAPQVIAPNVTLQTNTYSSINGSGFRVICIIKREDGAFIMRVKNYGPDINSEIDWPSGNIETALQNAKRPYP